MLENMFNKLQAGSRNSLGVGFMEYKMLKTPKVSGRRPMERTSSGPNIHLNMYIYI